MIDTIEITGVPIVKFKDKNTIDSMLAGNIWFNPLITYRKEEECNGDTVVGDRFEAMWPIRDAYFILPEENQCEHVVNGYIKTSHMNDYAFCIFGMIIKNGQFEFSEKQKEEMPGFGDTALMITNPGEFFKRVKEKLQEKNYKFMMDSVKYYDPKVDNMSLILSLYRGMENIAFWKRKDYAYQNEIRVLIPKHNYTDEHLEINDCDISDISVVMETERLLKARIQRVE